VTDQPLVSVIIPNWNGFKHLPGCLNALKAQTYQHVEVIVADNASTDGSQELLAKYYPWVRLEQLITNQGFTGACNAGLLRARGELLILLNNDTEADPAWIDEVVAAFERHPEAGAVASKMLLFDRRDHLHTAGDLVRVDGLPVNRGVWQPDDPEYNEEIAVFSACGGSAAYRRSTLDEIGLLDDDFFFSMEDVDLGWRAQLAGWKCIYAPRAVVYHQLAATGGGKTASYYDGRNTLWVIAKNYPTPLLRKYWPEIVRGQWRRAWAALRAWRGEAARAQLRGILAGLVTLPRVLRKRRVIQAGRKVSIEDLEAILTPVNRAG